MHLRPFPFFNNKLKTKTSNTCLATLRRRQITFIVIIFFFKKNKSPQEQGNPLNHLSSASILVNASAISRGQNVSYDSPLSIKVGPLQLPGSHTRAIQVCASLSQNILFTAVCCYKLQTHIAFSKPHFLFLSGQSFAKTLLEGMQKSIDFNQPPFAYSVWSQKSDTHREGQDSFLNTKNLHSMNNPDLTYQGIGL